MRGGVKRLFVLGSLVFLGALASNAVQADVVLPLASGDETIVVTNHQVKTNKGVIKYEARIGRLPIRNDESGEVHGYIGFTSYTVKSNGAPRPIAFLWNGGPTSDSILVHTELFGPRRYDHGAFMDNAETLLSTADLVFMDPVGTGFSRPAKPEYDKEFLSVLGDFAATAEFVRAYRAKFDAERQPLFLGGESYGTWRVNGATEMLTNHNIKVAGAILISGGIPGSKMSFAFQDAMYIPARTATAFALNKLSPDLMKDRDATLKAVNAWIVSTYMPALEHPDTLNDAQRDKIADDLAHYTGVRPDQVNHKTLIMSNNEFKSGLFEGDKSKQLNTYDMRIVGNEPRDPDHNRVVAAYLRDDLGYHTDLAYDGLETGYMPTPGPAHRSTSSRWSYNHTEVTPEMDAHMHAGGGPPDSQPWLQNAMRKDPEIRVFVAAGRYDSLNMCEGNQAMAAKQTDLVSRFTLHCYEGGHMMYHVPETRPKLLNDIAKFVSDNSHHGG